jgi:GLPGLI family protein
MKKIFLSTCLLTGLFASAQMKEGKVVYERTMTMQMRNMNINGATINGGGNGNAPQVRKSHFELLFSNNQVLWQTLPTAEESGPITGTTASGQSFTFNIQVPNELSYYNIDAKKRVDRRELFEREFIVEDSIRSLSWKLSDETKTILGHPVRKATSQRIATRTMTTMQNGEMQRREVTDTSQIIAWFATDIPVSAGPQEFQGQLPGLILELDMNKGRNVYTAIEISPKVNVAAIKEPKKGKRLTEKEFVAERTRLMDEMRKNRPGGSDMIIMN